MQIDITGHHVDVTDALRAHVEDKLSKLERHCARISLIHVVLIVEKDRQRAEASCHMGHHDLFAMDEQDDMYKAIDKLALKLDRQLLRYRQKDTSHR